jgi:hypothetical protein
MGLLALPSQTLSQTTRPSPSIKDSVPCLVRVSDLRPGNPSIFG